MSKKTKKKAGLIVIKDVTADEYQLAVDLKGNIIEYRFKEDADGNETDEIIPYCTQLTTLEIDAIAEEVQIQENRKHDRIESVSAGHEIEYSDGSIGVGCQTIEHKDVLRVHKLSLAMRNRRKK